MRKIKRKIKTPDCLEKEYEHTGKTVQEFYTESWKNRVLRFQNRQIRNPPAFNWYGINTKLRPLLLDITQRHCAFCDWKFTNDYSENFPIEHFYPKDKYADKAFEWKNLFPICTICNTKKGNKFSEELLKPDSPKYKIEDYFVFNYKNGEIQANPKASKIYQKRAKEAIENN